jgi:hypothetical protein
VPRLRSSLAAPGSARLVGTLVALAGVALLVLGVVALGGGDPGTSGAAPAPTATGTSAAPSILPPAPTVTLTVPPETATVTATVTPSPVPSEGTGVGSAPPTTTVAPRPTTARAPLTVLNNSTISGLGERVAGEAQARGWPVAQVGNFAGRLPATTVYYDPGNAAQEAAARQLARDFPQVEKVLPRYAGLPPTPAGIVLVVTKDW